MSRAQALLAAYHQAFKLNQAAIQALEEGRYDALEEIFEAKAGLDLAWKAGDENWEPQELSELGQAQAMAAQSEARLSQFLSQLGPKLAALRKAYRSDKPSSTGGHLDLGH